uniref:Argininosuccinate lyase n=1 Tax=uncultured bacterium A1Q1_fos_862 TaxID=1256590 RepID=L7VXZ3_9BACT|nr:argininosuccinate lyase [uncultured bacterium A1Q1_fos_862]
MTGTDGSDEAERQQLWHGRFESGPAAELVEFTESLSYDQRLIFDDIRCSKAHVRGLRRGGLLSEDELARVLAALDTVEMEYRADELSPIGSDEDVHTLIERRVTELAGDAGAKLHTGRSRNDQVATAFRHHVRAQLVVIAARVLELVDVLAARADEAGTGDDAVYLPGYTHLQHAQPVLLAHHLMAHAWALLRDVDRLADCRRRVDVSPLGAGALAGSSLPLDPDGVAAELGFASRFENSLDATSDRDFVAESLFVLSLIGLHLSRMGEEVVLWSTEEFGFARLDDAYATGSSMLPQKKNPDIAELARGKAGRIIGDLTGFLATMKSLPLAYNRDLQEDKEPLFDALDTVRLGLGAMAGLYRTVVFDTDRMRSTADSPFAAATDLAEHLVRRGVPFREAHAVVGALVRRSLDDGVPLIDLVVAEPRLGEEGVALLQPGVAVRQRTTPGSGGPGPVMLQRERLAAEIVDRRRRWEI